MILLFIGLIAWIAATIHAVHYVIDEHEDLKWRVMFDVKDHGGKIIDFQKKLNERKPLIEIVEPSAPLYMPAKKLGGKKKGRRK